jgi:hypothetical protein
MSQIPIGWLINRVVCLQVNDDRWHTKRTLLIPINQPQMTLVLRSQEVAQASRRDKAGEIEAGMAEWPNGHVF